MLPEDGRKPQFLQIYIYDTENELENRLQQFENLDRTVLQELQEMVKEVNPYAQVYQQAGEIIRQNPTEDIKLVLRACSQNNNIDPHIQFANRHRCCSHTSNRQTNYWRKRCNSLQKSVSHPNRKQLMRIKQHI